MSFWPNRCFSELQPLKRVCRLNPEALSEMTDPDYEFDYIDIGNVTLEGGVVAHERMRFEDAPSRARKSVCEGDVIVSTVRTYLRAVAGIGQDADNWIVSTGFAVLRSKPGTEPRFLYRVVQSNPFVESVVAASTGVSYPAINESTLGNIRVPLPDLETQKTIADFLDRETTRIDQLIEKKQRLVALLKECRSARITAAVTGQTDATSHAKSGTSAKDGGGVRSAWQEYRLKHLVRVVVDKATNTNEKGAYVGLEAISSWTGQIDTQQNATTDQSLGNRFTLGDVLFGKLRPYLAKVAAPDFSGHCSGEALVLRPTSRISTRFLRYRMVEVGAIDAVNASTYGAKMPRASWEFIGNLRFHVPDLKTQKTIADYLARETTRIDTLIEKTEQSINRLREHRAALITAAVTGQLDVTTWRKQGSTDRHLDNTEETMQT